ncbi:MAG: hypothetical protein WAM39_11355 [Bryobacteraceae bacterium]
MPAEKTQARYALSRDEHAAMARYVGSIRQQLQEVSELFGSRYGKESNLADLSAKALVCTTLLEHELLYSEPGENREQDSTENGVEQESVIVKTAYHSK